jgi:hypothetical protein
VARAEEYGGSLYQRPPPPTRGRRPAALVVALLAALVVLAPAGPAAAEPPGGPDQFRVGGSVHRPDGTTAVTLVAAPSFGREPPPADRIDVIDAADGSKVKAKVDQLPAGRLEVVLVADASGGPGTVEAIQGALRVFLASLPEDAAVTVVSAGERPHLLAPLTRSRMTALASLALLAPTGPGLPEAAIEMGLDQLTGAPGTRPVVVEVRSGGFRTPTEAAAPLEPTRDRLRDLGVDVFAVELGTLLAGQDDALPVPLRDGFVIEARSNPDLVGTLDTIATDLAMARYRVVMQLGEPHYVRFQAEWPGVTPTDDKILGVYVPKREPLPDAAGPRLGRLAAAVAGVAVIAIVVLLPPWWRRRRVAKRAAVPPADAGLRLDPIPAATTATRPPAEVVPETGLGGEDVEGAAAVRALLDVGTRPVAELWLGDGVEPAVRAELEALAARRRVPIRSGSRPGAALPVAARALPLVPARLPALLSAGPSPVVLAVAGSPSPVELGRALAAADPGGGVDGEVPPITGVVLSRRPTRLTAAATAAAAGAVDRLPLALVRDLGAALASARAAGARVVGVVPGRPGRGMDGLQPAVAVAVPTVFVVAADDDLERRLRARCDEVVAAPGAGLAERVAAVVAALSPEQVDLRQTAGSPPPR